MELIDGYGYGYGDGSGYGYGYGSGSGYGDGSGYGYGYGDNQKSYITALIAPYEQPETTIAIWRSTADGYPANGGDDSLAAEVGQVQEVKGPLEICSSRALHGTLTPKKWKGDRWWIVALHHPVQEQDDKIASLKRTILKDLGKCPF